MSCANITQFTWRTITGIHPPRMLKVDLDNFETQKTHVYQEELIKCFNKKYFFFSFKPS